MKVVTLLTGLLTTLSLGGMAIAAELKARNWQEIANECVENYRGAIQERSDQMNELSAAYCRERVTGCTHFISLMRRGDGVYECRCR